MLNWKDMTIQTMSLSVLCRLSFAQLQRDGHERGGVVNTMNNDIIPLAFNQSAVWSPSSVTV